MVILSQIISHSLSTKIILQDYLSVWLENVDICCSPFLDDDDDDDDDNSSPKKRTEKASRRLHLFVCLRHQVDRFLFVVYHSCCYL